MEGIQMITNSKSKRFLAYCFFFLFGVCVISIVDKHIDLIFLYVSIFISIFFLIIFWSNKTHRFFAFLLLTLVLGITRYQLAFPLSPTNISVYNGEKQELTGYVVAEPDVRMDGIRYIVNIESIKDENKKTTGRVYVKSGLYPRYSYGEEVDLNCKLKAPEPVEDFAYDKFLARYKVFSICEGARIRKASNELKGNILFREVLSLKEVVAERINELWHEPYASFMAGLLYGYRGGLGQLNELFSRTGVTHIVAISGYNITIIAMLLITFCLQLYIPRKKAFWFVVSGIIVFLIFAGLSASVVRAGIMGILVLVAKQMGRMSRIGNVLVLTAVIMTLHNPFILMYDAGFQLSFLSTIGLVYLSPHIEKWFTRVPEAVGIRESLIATLSATIVTLPLILFQFGRLSIVAVPVNMLILWIIPFIMTIGFFAVVISFLFLPLATVIAWIAWAGMFYITSVVTWFSGLKFAAVDMRVPVYVMIGMYIVLLYYLKKWNTKNK
jgi:competence protein ComEC